MEKRNEVLKRIEENFIFPEDIIERLKLNKIVWNNYERLSEPYTRIRIAYINSARKRPEEFEKRLNNFIDKTKEKKLIKGFEGIEKMLLIIIKNESVIFFVYNIHNHIHLIIKSNKRGVRYEKFIISQHNFINTILFLLK